MTDRHADPREERDAGHAAASRRVRAQARWRGAWLFVAALLCPALALRHATADNGLPEALDGRLRAALISSYAAERLTQQSLPADGLPGGPAGPGRSAEPMVPCFIEGSVDGGALEAAGAIPGQRYAGRWTARVPLRRLVDVARLPGVRRMRAAARLAPQLDLSAADTKAALVQSGLPDTARGLTGEGVLLGVVDTGINWPHPDFKTQAGLTRIAAIWDQTDTIGPRPVGYTYGTAWTEAQINLGLCRESDSTYYGHGTHVAGIAAGSGRATGNALPPFSYVGVAPHARLAVVNTSWFDTDIADGVAWIFQQAAQLDLPCVVNLSLGSSYGPHDGTSDLDVAMNALSGPGRVVVASAGNQNGRGSHGEGTAPPTGYGLVSLRIFGYTPNATAPDGLSIDGWYEGGDDMSLTIRTPSGTLVGPVTKGSALAVATPDGWVSIDQTGLEPAHLNGDVEVLIEISDAAGIPPTVGEYELRLTRVAAPNGGKADFWIYDGSFSYPPAFAQGRVEQKTVLSPATADSVIAVAAHTTRATWLSINGTTYSYGQTLNQIGTFSSIGPRRDGVQKPDLSAPGSAIGSAHSPVSHPNPTNVILPDGVHKVLQGTSMSAPHVSGAVALLQQRFGNVGPGQARGILAATARTDAFTGAIPNATWGYGKLDLEQLFRRVQGFSTRIDPPYTMSAGNQIPLLSLCLEAGAQAWRIPGGHARVTDTRGWLKRQTIGPPLGVASFEDTTAPADPGQGVCIPRTGLLLVAVPAGTPSGDSTVVTLEMEPLGLPFMRQTASTTIRVGTLADAGDAPGLPRRLGLSVREVSAGHLALELAQPAAGRVSIALFDVMGRRVALLLDGPVEAGYRRVEWRGQGSARLSAGLYFARVVGERSRLVRRIMVTD